METDSAFMTLFWIQIALFLVPTLAALIWAGVHHWDLPDEMQHPQ